MNTDNTQKKYICECGKEFKSAQPLKGHGISCQIHKNVKKQKEDLLKQEKEAKRLPNGMFKCENPDCQEEHDGNYGSGRFCCKECAAHVRSLNSVKTSKKNGTLHRRCNFDIHKKNNGRSLYGTWKCERCNLIFETRKQLQDHNHEVHPIPKGSSWNKGLTKDTDERVANNAKHVSISLKEEFRSGRLTIKTCSNEFRQLQRQRAIERELGGKHSSKRIMYNGIELGSSYELQLAKSLDDNNIKWTKPSYFKWEHPITHKIHNYYPDFYLPEYDLYLDPKNDFLINNVNPHFGIKDCEKIKIVEETNNIKVIILNKEQLSWNEIQKLIIFV